MKNGNLENFSQNVNKILEEAKLRDYPYYNLIEYRKELDSFLEQGNCLHSEIKTIEKNNVRYWICEKCEKIIDYETIK